LYILTFRFLDNKNLGEGNSDTNSPDAGSSDISRDMKHRAVDGRDGSWSHSSRRDHSGFNGCCTAMWKANGKTTTLILFLDSLSPKIEVTCEMLRIALFGELSLEEAMDLAQDRLLLGLEYYVSRYNDRVRNIEKNMWTYEKGENMRLEETCLQRSFVLVICTLRQLLLG
jgi:hypothetical protein